MGRRSQLDAVSRTGVTVDGDMAYVGVNGGTVTAVDLAKGKVRWTAELGRPVATPLAAADGHGRGQPPGDRQERHPHGVVALDAASATERWRADAESQAGLRRPRPSIAGGTVVVALHRRRQESARRVRPRRRGRAVAHPAAPRLFDLTAPRRRS